MILDIKKSIPGIDIYSEVGCQMIKCNLEKTQFPRIISQSSCLLEIKDINKASGKFPGDKPHPWVSGACAHHYCHTVPEKTLRCRVHEVS